MKSLLLFFFTLAFLSLLSPSAYAQWGSTVTVSNDAEYLDAMHDASVEFVAFESGYYASIGKQMQETDMMIKNQPSSSTTKAPLASCIYATQKILPQCWNEFTVDRIDLLASRDATNGVCNAPDGIGWQLFSATNMEIGGTAVTPPTIVQDPMYTIGLIDYYPAHATGFVNGGVYYFTFGFSDGTLLMSPFRIWKLPSVNLGADFTVCMNNLSMQLSANNPVAAYSGLPSPQQNGVLSYFWTVSPGTATITNPTSATPTFSTTTPGVYTVQLAVTETVATYTYGAPPTTVPAHACTNYDTYLITVSNVTSLITAQTNVSCFGGANGTATVTPSGGTLPYTYSWNSVPAQNTATATGLAAGTYTVTVKDATQCSATASVTITQPAAALATTETHVNVDCFGNPTGSIDLSVAGGTTAYTYVWTASAGGVVPAGQANLQDLTGLVAGTYSVTVTDANKCTITRNITIAQPAAALATTETHVNVLCFGNNTGSIDLSVTGGTTAYTYVWTASLGGVIPAGQANLQDLSGLVAGTYSVTVTDLNKCTTTRSIIITQPAVGMETRESHVNVLCFGLATGSVDLTVTGGTTPYTYVWTASLGGVVPSGQANIQDLTLLLAGTYSVTVKDASQCTTTLSIIVTQPAAVLASSETHVNVLCFGDASGSIDLSVTGGTAAYTYAWAASAGGVIPAGQANNQDLTGLVAGTYSVTVTDANKCTTVRSISITQPAAILATTETHANVLCFGNASGSIDLSVTGGTAAYTYVWTASAGGVIPAGQSTLQDLSGLVAGTYSVTITDANQCSTVRSIIITQPAAGMTTSEQHVNVLCFGNASGSIDLSVAGGTAPYTYVWTASLGGVVPSGQANIQDLTLLLAGTYSVTVKDASQCTTTLSIIITQPAAILASSETHVNVLCFGNASGSIDLSVTGGTASYTYVWAATAGGAIPAGQANNQDLTGLVAGTYTVTITDANLCTTVRSITVTQPAAILATTETHVNVLCFGNNTGSIDLSVTGGTTAYTYVWTASAGGIIPAGQANLQDLSGLVAGTYSVTVTDANQCSTVRSITITQPAVALATSETHVNVLCFGNATGSIDLSVSGGTTAYTYVWTASLGGVVPSAQANLQDLTGLVAGTYSVTVKDANQCTTTRSIIVTQPAAPLAATTTQVNVLCFGNATGSATAIPIGGTGAYSYSWNTTPAPQTTATATGLAAGTYVVTITDANGCSITRSVTISQNADFRLVCHADITVCSLANPFTLISLGGFATVPAGITGTYQFFEGTTPLTTFNPITAGPHTITYIFTDGNGCSKSCSFVITVEPMAEAGLEGQVKYFNSVETYMETPFPTDIYGTTPPDYFYVALYEARPAKSALAKPTFGSAIDWQKVDIVQEEDASGNITKNLMSYFKFDTKLVPNREYFIRVWDGSNLYQESVNVGTATGMLYNPELGSSYTWNNWGGVTGIDALGMQYMINGATQINATPYNWNWIGNKLITAPADLNYGFYSNSIANVNSVNDITALDALTTQYRIAGLQPTFPNMVPNFRVAGRFVDTLPRITFPRPFTTHNFPIDLRFTKSAANYTYFTPAVDNYYQSDVFTLQPFFNVQNNNLTSCPDLGYINIYYTATGDVNASYVPPSHNFKSAETAMTLKYENEIVAHKGEIIDIPISVDRSADLGSISLGVTFRKDLIKVLEVPGYEVVNIDNEKGIVRVVWADMNGRSVNADDAIVSIKALILSDIGRENRLFELEAMTELGNVQAQKIENVNLKTSVVTTKPAGKTQLFVDNYPNPFSKSTKISYYLPESGAVNLVVYNNLGAKLVTLVDQYQLEGTHVFDLKLSDLKPGAYFYRLVLKGAKDQYSATRNMMVVNE